MSNNIRQISISFTNENQMAEAYMPFLRNGGFFIPTDREFKLGDELFIALTLPDEPNKRSPAPAKVVWINLPNTVGGRQQGIGIAFTGVRAQEINKRFSNLVKKASRKPTGSKNTM